MLQTPLVRTRARTGTEAVSGPSGELTHCVAIFHAIWVAARGGLQYQDSRTQGDWLMIALTQSMHTHTINARTIESVRQGEFMIVVDFLTHKPIRCG
jgi:hypothetical protein